MVRIVGVDPGKKGALALICEGVVLDCIDVPLMPDNSQVQIDGDKLFRWIERNQPFDVAVIENVQPMRNRSLAESLVAGAGDEGMRSGDAFRFGMICGELRMAFKCYGVRIKLVTPGTWKRHFELLKSGKEDSRQKALRLRPEAAQWLPFKNTHNRAEAMLLGLYEAEKRGMF